MGFLAEHLDPWGPYSLATLGAAVIAFGLLSGLLLVPRQRGAFSRPYFVSAFGAGLVTLVVAALERPVLTGEHAWLKALLILVTLGYGIALLQRAFARRLASRSPRAFLIVGGVCMALPLATGLVGMTLARSDLVAALANSAQDTRALVAHYSGPHVDASVWALSMGVGFLALASFVLFARRLRHA